MAKHSHLTLQERSLICVRITQDASFSQVAAELERDPGTISREIRKHRIEISPGAYGHHFNPCIHKKTCTKKFPCNPCLNGGKKCSFCKFCTKHCPDF